MSAERYETFVNEILRNDLKRVATQHDAVVQQLNDYCLVKQFCAERCGKMKTLTDLGANFYAKTVVAENEMILMRVTSDVYCQLTAEEAIRFIAKRETQMNEKLKDLRIESSRIKTRIKIILNGLAEMQQL